MPATESPTLPPSVITSRLAAASTERQADWVAILEFATAVQRRGGIAYVVGGAVRDLLWNALPQEFDLEVHRLPADTVEALATALGPVNSVGHSFGVLKILRSGRQIDITLPRHETKIGAGHRDFSIGIDPFMGVPAAARRRDFTLGAVYLNILTGQIEDPYGGVADIRERRLAVVDPATFREDPLRFLRAMQLTARFGLTLAPATIDVLRDIVPELGSLSGERIRDEWKKILLASQPSRGLEVGRLTGYFEQWHPEVAALTATPQDPQQHPEGSAWNHTLLAVDHAARLADQEQSAPAVRSVVVLATLVHDLGKPSMTRNVEGKLQADGHEAAGLIPARQFLERIHSEDRVINRILPIVSAHRRLDQMFHIAKSSGAISAGHLRQLVHDIRPATFLDLLLVTTADQLGRGPFARPDGLVAMPERYDGYAWGKKVFQDYRLNEPADPILSGHDLIERAWPPGPLIGEAVQFAEQLSWTGLTRTDVINILKSVPTPAAAVAALRTLAEAEHHETNHPATRS